MLPKRWFMDASALAHLYADEGPALEVRNWYAQVGSVWTNVVCIVEALGVLKRRWQRGHLTDRMYREGCAHLLTDVRCNRIELSRTDFTEAWVLASVQNIGLQHGLDFSDALQLLSLAGSPEQNILVTTDEGLEAAAKSMRITVWHCRRDCSPPVFAT